MNNVETIDYNPNINGEPINEMHGIDLPIDIEDIERVISSVTTPVEFSDAIRNMSVGELLNQIKGTEQDLYIKLTKFLRDVYHETNEDEGCGINSMSDFPMPNISKRVIVMRGESKENTKIDTDLLIEAYKAKKAVKLKYR